MLSNVQVKQMGYKDSRIKLVNEILNGIKVNNNLVLYTLRHTHTHTHTLTHTS